jgi:hypothetical protein
MKYQTLPSHKVKYDLKIGEETNDHSNVSISCWLESHPE